MGIHKLFVRIFIRKRIHIYHNLESRITYNLSSSLHLTYDYLPPSKNVVYFNLLILDWLVLEFDWNCAIISHVGKNTGVDCFLLILNWSDFKKVVTYCFWTDVFWNVTGVAKWSHVRSAGVGWFFTGIELEQFLKRKIVHCWKWSGM